MKRLVIIDNGHGYDTQGKASKMPNGEIFEEWEYNRIIKLRLISKMHREQYPFFDLVPESRDISLIERSNRANSIYKENKKFKPFLVSIHGDAFTNSKANGITVFTSIGETKSDPIGDVFVEKLSELGWTNRYDIDADRNKGKEANFHILRETLCEAVLIELGFFTNPEDVMRMHDSMVQEKIVDKMFDAIKIISQKF